MSGLVSSNSLISAQPVAFESTRRRLSSTQAAAVAKLTEAAVELIAEDGFDKLTVRLVAKRAGVAPATAYTYFSSKNHLMAEVFWRRLNGADFTFAATKPTARNRTARVVKTLRTVALLVADNSDLARAVTGALLGTDPDVEQLRLQIGWFVREKLASSLSTATEIIDPKTDDPTISALEMLYSGALVRAGMGYETYEKIADRLEITATRLLEV